MNPKIRFLSVIFLLSAFCSCDTVTGNKDPFLICKASEYDCDYQHQIPGIITVTKGSRRKHYILTGNGMEKINIKEGEPLAFDRQNKVVLVKEFTDSSIDIFTVSTDSGEKMSSKISLKPKSIKNENGKSLLSIPTLLGSCLQNDGTIILLLNFEFADLGIKSESRDFLYVYEKGDRKKLKKYPFSQENRQQTAGPDDFSSEDLHNIQCTGNGIYVFSEKNYDDSMYYSKYYPQPNWFLNKIILNPEKTAANIENLALIAYDDIRFNHYSEKENAVYTTIHPPESKTEKLRILRLDEGYEIPDEPIEKTDGEFLFSETTDGKMLVFFVKNRTNTGEEERLEPIRP
ncbi:hypothetical protein J6Z19_03530 [bacterium]|nr:hypothetical protein [bacterium]